MTDLKMTMRTTTTRKNFLSRVRAGFARARRMMMSKAEINAQYQDDLENGTKAQADALVREADGLLRRAMRIFGALSTDAEEEGDFNRVALRAADAAALETLVNGLEGFEEEWYFEFIPDEDE
jgi:hypothetical protein